MEELDHAKGRQAAAAGRAWRRLSRYERLVLVCTAGSLLGAFSVAYWLTPDPRGLGTHEQLGLAPCFTQVFFNIPCPFCGMTTAFSLMVHGRPVEAFLAQPAGAIAFVIGAAACVLCAVFAFIGRCPYALVNSRSVEPWWIPTLVVLAAAWLYKLVTHFF